MYNIVCLFDMCDTNADVAVSVLVTILLWNVQRIPAEVCIFTKCSSIYKYKYM